MGYTKPVIRYNQEKPRVTQQEIARLAGVSQVAVSHTLHRPLRARISEEKQAEIRRIARELGYVPRSMTTHTIALALPVGSLSLEITSSIIHISNEVLRTRGYRLSLLAYDEQQPEPEEYLLDQKRADGVLLTDILPEGQRLLAPELPRVLMSDAEDALVPKGMDQVALDTKASMGNIIAYLASLGHERIGLVAAVTRDSFDNHLRDGFKAALKREGLAFRTGNVIEVGRDGRTAEPLLRCMAQKNAPTAIVSGSAAKAVLVMNALQWRGYQVPDQVSVVSLTDSDRLPLLCPAVTATTAAGLDVITQAVERLLRRIEEPSLPAERILIPGTLVVRESVSAPASK